MNDDLISVMIPCYESSKTLAKALASLMLQSHKNWEALVVDDGSADHPEKIIQFFKDSRIRYFRVPENRGRAYARQVALDNMRGDFLTMLDADDWILPNMRQPCSAAWSWVNGMTIACFCLALI